VIGDGIELVDRPTSVSRLFLSPPHLGGEELEYLEEAIASNWIAPLGPMVDAFEREFAEALGFPYALAVSSGTAALHLALHSLGTRHGDAVVAATLTFIASVSPAVYLGATPVFVDADSKSWTADPDLIEQAVVRLLRAGRRVAAILPTDLYGQSCDLDAICEIGQRHGIPVLVDSAEALGARYKDRSVGHGAAAAVFSFNGNKIITTSCGGMIVSHEKRLIDHARYLSQQARDPVPHYQHATVGYNYRMSNLLAAVGRAQLKLLEDRVEKRRSINAAYAGHFRGIPGIEMMPEAAYGRATKWLSVITIDPERFGADRDAVIRRLAEQNIEARPVWKPMHLQPVFASSEYFGRGVSDRLFRTGLCLPSGSQMTESEVDQVAEAVLASTGAGCLELSARDRHR
jgi:dTDP-4-amino-4,6-dideoxygalactose transaminase